MVNNNFKYFVTGLNPEVIEELLKLRKLFPSTANKKFFYLKGNYKNRSGTYVVTDLKNFEYGSVVKSVLSKQLGAEVFFWPPACDPKEFDLDSWYVSREPIPYVTVELKSGHKVKINPASGEPKEFLFGEPVEEERIEFASLFSKATEYGSLAYKLIYKEEEFADQGGFPTNDPDLINLVNLGFQNSYSVPKDVLNWLRWVSFQDMGELYKACLGATPNFIEWLQG